jgi:hypothetical protein
MMDIAVGEQSPMAVLEKKDRSGRGRMLRHMCGLVVEHSESDEQVAMRVSLMTLG